jgi:hypothetical protein
MLQAPIFDSPSLDPFTLLVDGLRTAGVGIGMGGAVQAIIVAVMVETWAPPKTSGM